MEDWNSEQKVRLLSNIRYRGLFDQEWYYYAFPTKEPTTRETIGCPCIVLRDGNHVSCGHRPVDDSSFCSIHTKQLKFVKDQKNLKTASMNNGALSKQDRLIAAYEVLHYRKVAMSLFADNDWGHEKAIVWTEAEIQLLQKLVADERKAANEARKAAKKKKSKPQKATEASETNEMASLTISETSPTDSNTNMTERQKTLEKLARQLDIKINIESTEYQIRDEDIVDMIIQDKQKKEKEMQDHLVEQKAIQQAIEERNVQRGDELLSGLTDQIAIFTTPWPNGGQVLFIMKMASDHKFIIWANSIFNYDFVENEKSGLLNCESATIPSSSDFKVTNLDFGKLFNTGDPTAIPLLMISDVREVIHEQVQTTLIAIRKIESIKEDCSLDSCKYIRTGLPCVTAKFENRNPHTMLNPFPFPDEIYDRIMPAASGIFAMITEIESKSRNNEVPDKIKKYMTGGFREVFKKNPLFNMKTTLQHSLDYAQKMHSKLVKLKGSESRNLLTQKLEHRRQNTSQDVMLRMTKNKDGYATLKIE